MDQTEFQSETSSYICDCRNWDSLRRLLRHYYVFFFDFHRILLHFLVEIIWFKYVFHRRQPRRFTWFLRTPRSIVVGVVARRRVALLLSFIFVWVFSCLLPSFFTSSLLASIFRRGRWNGRFSIITLHWLRVDFHYALIWERLNKKNVRRSFPGMKYNEMEGNVLSGLVILR